MNQTMYKLNPLSTQTHHNVHSRCNYLYLNLVIQLEERLETTSHYILKMEKNLSPMEL